MIKIWKNLFLKIKKTIELSGYNDFTIAEYFRKQGAQIGGNNRIELRSLGTEPFLIKIGNHCTIAPNVLFLTHDGGIWVFTEEIPSLQKFGPIVIHDNCFIGIGSIIMPNVTIGPNSIVGAGAVVTKNVPPNVVVAGNPAKTICSVEEYKEKTLRIWKEQKPAEYFSGLKDGVKYPPEYIQQIKYRDMHILREHLVKRFWGKDLSDTGTIK